MGLMDQVEMPQPVKFILNWGRRYSLWVMNFGLACCAIELIATSTSKHDFIRLGVIPFAHAPAWRNDRAASATLARSGRLARAELGLYRPRHLRARAATHFRGA